MLTVQETVEKIRQVPRLIVVDDYEVVVQQIQQQSRQYQNGKLVEEERKTSFWVSLRLLHRKRMGTYFSTLLMDNWELLVEGALSSAENSGIDPWQRFPIWKSSGVKGGEEREEISLESQYPDLRCPTDFVEERYQTATLQTGIIRKTEKLHLHYKERINSAAFLVAGRVQSTPVVLGEKKRCSMNGEWRSDSLSRILEASQSLENCTQGVPTGKILLSPKIVAALLSRIAGHFSASRGLMVGSPLYSVRGKKIFSSLLNILDDPEKPEAGQIRPFDLEGVLSQKTMLVEEGVFTDFLYDSYHAAKQNRASSAHRSRNWEEISPRIDHTNLYIVPAGNSRETLLQSLANGWFLDEPLSLQVEFGEAPLQVTLCALGWKVSQGNRVERVVTPRIKIDLLSLFQLVEGVGSDLEFHDSVGAPSILFSEIPLSIDGGAV